MKGSRGGLVSGSRACAPHTAKVARRSAARRGGRACLRALKPEDASSSGTVGSGSSRSIADLQSEMEALQQQIHEAHLQAHVQEQRIAEGLRVLEVAGERSKALEATLGLGTAEAGAAESTRAGARDPRGDSQQPSVAAASTNKSGLRSDLTWPEELKDYWYPLEFSKNLKAGGDAVDFVAFDMEVSLWRSAEGEVNVGLRGEERQQQEEDFLKCHEKDGMVWCWVSDKKEAPAVEEIPGFTKAPAAFREDQPFTIHAELVIDVEVEHGLLLENLLDLAHAPFTHTQTFAKGWSIPDLVKFNTSKLLGGNWEPYPIDMSFEPPCMVLSTIGLMQPGKLEEGARASACQNHLHQLHVCIPSAKGTRLLYRMSLDFMGFMLYVPFAKKIWETMAAQVLSEDLRLVQGQEDRLRRGGDTWRNPVPYDKLAVRYRKWRNSLEDEEERRRQEKQLRTMSAGEMLSPVEEE